MSLGPAREPDPLSPHRAGALAFLAAGTTLFVQVLAHRMISAKLLNNYAFLVISLTMLGFALSGVILTRALPIARARARDAMAACASLFALSFIGISVFFYQAPLNVYLFATRAEFAATLLRTLPYALVYAVPFLFVGLILGTLLAAPDLPTRAIYAFDLVGSSLGAIVVIPAISSLGVERAGLVACLVLLVGTLLTLPPRSKPVWGLAGLGIAVIVAGLFQTDRLYALRYPAGSWLGSLTEGSPPKGRILHVAWDPVARIEVSTVPTPVPSFGYPCLIGDDPEFLKRFELMITQNNFAYTYAAHYTGKPGELEGAKRTLYAAAYEAVSVPHPRALVIGVGGGFDILTALSFDPERVTAVEINTATVGILTRTFHDYFGAWVGDPRVHLVNAEGRSYLTRSKEQYDVIQLSGVDSYSGTAGAAHVFSENYLYTQEAFELYISKLSEQGVLNVMRIERHPPAEVMRALVTATAALRRLGIENPQMHVALVGAVDGNYTALLVKRAPFARDEVLRLKAWSDSSPFFNVIAGAYFVPNAANAYDDFLHLGSAAREHAYAELYPFDIHPSTDDRPFFFRFSYWSDLFPKTMISRRNVPVLEYSLVILLVLVGAAAFFCIYVPLWLMGSPSLLRDSRWRYALYCAGIALAYLAIEIAFLQRFGLLLGHPNYSLSIVLASLLVATGIGSSLSSRILGLLGHVRFVAYALAFLILAERAFVFPWILQLIGLPFYVRAALVCALVAPVGILMGVFFPTVLEALKVRSPAFVPWAWGINGIFSVLAPILSVMVTTTFGVNALFLAAIPIYLAAAFALP